MPTDTPNEVFLQRWKRTRERIASTGAHGILLGGGSDLAYLTGYEAMPLERITAFAGKLSPPDSKPALIVPALEAARVRPRPSVYSIKSWGDSTDPVEAIAEEIPDSGTVLISDDLWAMHVIGLQRRTPHVTLIPIGEATGGLREIKSPAELDALAEAGSLADRVMAQVQGGEVSLVGRTEVEIADDISGRLLAAGHDTVEFVIVASGPNSASPHHHPGSRVVKAGEIVLFDFGGSFNGYCSDTTRCVYTGPIPDEVRFVYTILAAAQEAAVLEAQPGRSLAEVDLAARSVIGGAGFGDNFIHRTGHGIGVEVHEHPYVTKLNNDPIEIGHAFSIEPGIYFPGKWGMRLEDIVVIEADGARRCNNSDRSLLEV
ncbi:MAG: Xaa-Pro peptidase family protein [bacterium]|nr:Xaa-Pro peptidase family protein [bacterium]